MPYIIYNRVKVRFVDERIVDFEVVGVDGLVVSAKLSDNRSTDTLHSLQG